MIALKMRGLVETRQGSGIYVTQALPAAAAAPAPELDVGAFELNEARVLFEGEAAALAATSIEAETLAELDRVLELMARGADSPAALDADRQFHLLIAGATGNSLVRMVVEMLWNIREQSPLCVHMFNEARREGVTPRVEEHRMIVDALRARDSQRARDAMRAHLRRVTEDLLVATELEQMQRARAEADALRSRVVRRAAV
jgi:DNA-binding FadR family transcriptional regulator